MKSMKAYKADVCKNRNINFLVHTEKANQSC